MPYEVFSLFSRCAETHGEHSSLDEAAACFAQLTQRYAGDIPVHPISQKYVHEIAAVDKNGNQRNFSEPDGVKAAALHLDPRSVATEVPGITTFSHLAKMYNEASRLIPVTGINLKGMFDHHGEDRHFWNTDAGKGQALAYAQQAAFTLELSLKAYLEVLGKLASTNPADIRKWRKHELTSLFKLLTDDEKKQLEDWWNQSDAKRVNFKGSFREFLSESNKLYMKWRYITELKSPDLSIDIPILLSAADFLLSASERVFRKSSPIKVNITATTNPSTEDSEGRPTPRSTTTLVEGRVRTVNVPDGFDPFSIVELVIDSDRHEHEVIAQFYKRNVKDYYGLKGERVTLAGEIREDRLHLLPHPRHLDEPKREVGYTSERRTLRGSIHDIRIIHSAFGGAGKLHLALWDETFVTQVECFFVTDGERAQVREFNLGDKVMISGCVTLLNGEPTMLVAPDQFVKVLEEPDAHEGSSRTAVPT